MAVGRIEEIRRIWQRQFHQEGKVHADGYVVGIERSDPTTDHVAVLANAAT